ncbi:hypothetical protein PISMIDRAFT_210899 [Pisolithus microcarpus 441]|uniref:F-box domain-containing protein n=1 Tax=Pisolithus microcarpus 441 TaxID=765257 RepID=A0A0C9Z5Z4_9AGAM|nr:hypothetical protein PISMIDRAFT_210899 [Pisolithus microcarpus 441]
MQLPRARPTVPARLPHLPPEIWDQILDVATYVPYSFAPEILERSCLIGHPYNSECRAALWSALLTKGTIVRVCKQWWYIAIRHLYRAIYIRDTRDVLSLRNTLGKYAEGNGTVAGVESLGSWTQRVDIVFDDDSTVDEESLADIFKFLPNLAVFSGTFSSTDSVTYLQPTIHALLGCASSLRVFDWSASDDNVLEPRVLRRFEALVRDLPQLHTLNFPGLLQLADGTITKATLTSVHTLCLRDLVVEGRFRHEEDTTLLNLRELVLYTPPRWQEPSWRRFLHHYGPYFTSVQLRATSDPGLIPAYLSVVNQTCPNIRRLTLFVLSFSDIPISATPASDIPPVEYLGLSVRRLQCRSMYETLFSSLAILKEELPTLHVVQLLDRQIVEDLLKYNLPLVSRAVEQGLIGDAFRLVDHDGNLLSGEC